jgi:membrane associated rhomboid family serine protease
MLLITLALIHLGMFALFLLGEGAFVRLQRPLMLDPFAWREGFPLVPIWQLGTYGLLHDVHDLMHLLGNLLILYFFGTALEEELGRRRFLWTYAGSQLAGALVFLVAAWMGMPSGVALGASGACYGVMIAVATLFPDRTVYLLFFPIKMRWLAVGILVLTVYAALVQMKGSGSSTAHLIHLGGIAYGFVAVRTGLVRKDPVEILERRRAVAKVERATSDAQHVDQLLEKIARQGIGSLSKSEREFLKRASSRK